MSKNYFLALLAAATALTVAAEVRTAEFNFQQPFTITPASAAPVVPEVPSDRSSFHETDITGVEFTADGVGIVVTGGTGKHIYTWRRGYDDTGTKRTGDDKLNGTYYLSVKTSTAEDDETPSPLSFKVTAPEGATITSVELRGQNKANTSLYMCTATGMPGSMEYTESNFTNTWTADKTQPVGEIVFDCPRKRPDGVNLGARVICGVKVTYSVPEEPRVDGLKLPFTRTFKSSADLEDFTIVDANEDGKTWHYYSSSAQLDWPSTQPKKDDWLISPPLAVAAGKYHKVEIHVNGSTYGELVKVYAGTTNKPENMTRLIINESVPGAYSIYRYWLKTDTDEPVYIAIHGLTPNDNYGVIKVKQITMDEPTDGTAPGEVTDFRCLSDPSGAKKAELSFTAPTVDLDGNELTSLDALEVYCGSYEGNCTTLIERITDTAPGQRHSITYSASGNGVKTFRVVGVNASGAGREMFTKGYVGVNKPANVTNVVARETVNPGEVKLSWDAPALDRDGYAINPALISYTVTGDGIESFTTKDTSVTFRACSADTHKFTHFFVIASTATGSSLTHTRSNSVAVGKPEAAPLREGFVGRGTMPVLTTGDADLTDGGTSKIFNESDLTGNPAPRAADGDSWFAGFYAYSKTNCVPMLTGKIDLAGLESPTASINVLALGKEGAAPAYADNVLHLDAAEAGSNDFIEVASVKMSDLATSGWHRISGSLAPLAGKTVQLRISADIASFASEGSLSLVIADNLVVGEPVTGTDLEVAALLAPSYAEPGKEFTLEAVVANPGAVDVVEASATLLCNGTEVATASCPTIRAGGSARVLFNQTLGVFDKAEVLYTVKVEADGDTNEANNEAAAAPIKLHLPVDKAPTTLAANIESQNEEFATVALTWIAPRLAEGDIDTVTEGFENATAWAQDTCEGWTFFDNDGAPVGLPTGMVLPGIDEGVTRMAYVVSDTEYLNFTHSGNHALASFYNFDSRTCSNWLISPELSGRAQTIKLWAMCASDRYGDTMRWLTSTTSRAPESFSVASQTIYLGTAWAEYTLDVAEGTRFFAIEQTSTDGWMMFIDDITYEPATAGAAVSLEGYNVYRDGQLLTDAVDVSATDTKAAPGLHTYCVTALYSRGESVPSEYITIDVPAYDSVAAVAAEVLRVKVTPGTITIINPNGIPVDIYALTGLAVAHTSAAGETSISVAPGIYIVSAPGILPMKTIVK